MKKPQIIIVDDHKIFRQSLKSIITVENIATVIGEASNGEEFLNMLRYTRPDLVLMDLDMPGMNGLQATQKAFEIMPDIKIIAFTMFGDEEYFVKMIELGVKGYILKSSDISELEKAIHVIMKGEKYFSNKQFNKNSYNLENRNRKKLSDKVHSHNEKSKDDKDQYPQWY
ncbi:MAG: response regulator transcription factor [Paludibacter sp.]|nr:response regulator transcription factor [Paludibacter sp.]